MSNQPDGVDHNELLTSDRELTREEQLQLRRVGERSWVALGALVSSRARATYAVAAPEEFSRCVREHMETADWEEMVVAGLYECPVCHLLLKDRKSPVSSAILMERRRVRELWMGVEASSPEQMDGALNHFRRALGLP